eukprot:9001394-Pyramimonas_sp.AAC.1
MRGARPSAPPLPGGHSAAMCEKRARGANSLAVAATGFPEGGASSPVREEAGAASCGVSQRQRSRSRVASAPLWRSRPGMRPP